MDLCHGINPHQSVAGMVADYNKREAALDAAAEDPCSVDASVPIEEMAPSTEGLRMVAKGRLNPETGYEIPPTVKARSAERKQFGTISPEYLRGYDGIVWE